MNDRWEKLRMYVHEEKRGGSRKRKFFQFMSKTARTFSKKEDLKKGK